MITVGLITFRGRRSKGQFLLKAPVSDFESMVTMATRQPSTDLQEDPGAQAAQLSWPSPTLAADCKDGGITVRNLGLGPSGASGVISPAGLWTAMPWGVGESTWMSGWGHSGRSVMTELTGDKEQWVSTRVLVSSQ